MLCATLYHAAPPHMHYTYLKIESNGSSKGSHTPRCELKEEAVTDVCTTAFIACGWACTVRWTPSTVASTTGCIWGRRKGERRVSRRGRGRDRHSDRERERDRNSESSGVSLVSA